MRAWGSDELLNVYANASTEMNSGCDYCVDSYELDREAAQFNDYMHYH